MFVSEQKANYELYSYEESGIVEDHRNALSSVGSAESSS
jgi:hypothetical protein